MRTFLTKFRINISVANLEGDGQNVGDYTSARLLTYRTFHYGSLIEYQYHLNPRFAISAKYQSIEYYYQPADATFDGSGLGIGISFQL